MPNRLDMSTGIFSETIIANGVPPPISMASFPSMETLQPEWFTDQPDITGSQIEILVANKTDEFKLQGPAPLQSTKPVACGDLGCVYNHLNWFVGGGKVVAGCDVNQSTCSVIVPPPPGRTVPPTSPFAFALFPAPPPPRFAAPPGW